jgi:hypothetical protein
MMHIPPGNHPIEDHYEEGKLRKMKPPLRRILRIFLRNKVREVFVEHVDEWIVAGVAFVAIALVTAGVFGSYFLYQKYPFFALIVGRVGVCLLCIGAILVVVIVARNFCVWIRDNWKRANEEARG